MVAGGGRERTADIENPPLRLTALRNARLLLVQVWYHRRWCGVGPLGRDASADSDADSINSKLPPSPTDHFGVLRISESGMLLLHHLIRHKYPRYGHPHEINTKNQNHDRVLPCPKFH